MTSSTIGQLLREAVHKFGSLPFLIENGKQQSFAEFDHQVDRLCSGLLRLGIVRGDHIAIWLPNISEWVLFFAACGRIGAVAVPVNTRYKPTEARHVIAQSDAKLLVMLPAMWRNNYAGMLLAMAPEIATGDPKRLSLSAFPSLRNVVMVTDNPPPGMIALSELFCDDIEIVDVAEAITSPRDLLLICYTSGTTGQPKGVMHHHGVIRQATKVGLAMRAEAGGRVLGHMPFYHAAGLFMAIIPAMALGLGLVPMVQWDPDEALELIKRERITIFGGVPTHFYDLVEENRIRNAQTDSLKTAWIGGSAVMQQTFERIKNGLKLDRLLSTYGMTENTISTSFNAWDDPVEVCCRNKAPILSDCEVRIVDPETFEDVAPGQEGEIWCRGETVMMGYYKDPEATRVTITQDGWLRSGDIGMLDSNGYLTVTTRLKEMLKVGGTNTSPIEIEQLLAGLPGLRSSVVVGVPDERLGQVVYAFIQPAQHSPPPTADEVIAFCRARLADYKVPRFVTFIDEFPRTTTGKIQRVVLARQAEEEITALHAAKRKA